MSDNHQNTITESWSPKSNDEETAVLNQLNAGRELREEAYTSIDELRQYTPQDLKNRVGGLQQESQDTLAPLGNLDIRFESSSGDKYLANDKNEITEFTYTDKDGKPTQSFEDIQYKYGEVEGFTLNGEEWTRGKTSWNNQKGEPLNLGIVSFDKSGMTATGSDSARLEAPQRTYRNDVGNEYQLNANGKVAQFTYRDQAGNSVAAFTNIQYDTDGKVAAFTTLEGDEFHRLPENETSPSAEESATGRWTSQNAITGADLRSPMDLGEVTVDAQGIHVSAGAEALNLIYKPLIRPTMRVDTH